MDPKEELMKRGPTEERSRTDGQIWMDPKEATVVSWLTGCLYIVDHRGYPTLDKQ